MASCICRSMNSLARVDAVIAPAVIADAAGGDAAALERIIRRYHDEMTGICMVVPIGRSGWPAPANGSRS